MSKKNITIIDADSIVYIIAYKFKDITKITQATKRRCHMVIDEFVKKILKDTDADEYLGFFGTPGGKKCFRYTTAVTVPYKHTRTAKEDWFVRFQGLILDRLIDEWKFTGVEGYEADDYVCQAASLYRDENEKVTVAAIDKDIKQVRGVLHYTYNPGQFVKNKTVSVTDAEAYYQLYHLILAGDVSDGYGGVPGIGRKKAGDILANCKSEWSFYRRTIEAYYKHFKGLLLEKAIDRLLKEHYAIWKESNSDKRLTKAIKEQIYNDLEEHFIEVREGVYKKSNRIWLDRFQEIYDLAKLPDTGTYRSDIIIPTPLKNEFKINASTLTRPKGIKDFLDSIS